MKKVTRLVSVLVTIVTASTLNQLLDLIEFTLVEKPFPDDLTLRIEKKRGGIGLYPQFFRVSRLAVVEDRISDPFVLHMFLESFEALFVLAKNRNDRESSVSVFLLPPDQVGRGRLAALSPKNRK